MVERDVFDESRLRELTRQSDEEFDALRIAYQLEPKRKIAPHFIRWEPRRS